MLHASDSPWEPESASGGGVGVPLSVVWSNITVSRRHPDIHRHPTGLCMYGQAAQEGVYPLPAYRRPRPLCSTMRGVYGPLGKGGSRVYASPEEGGLGWSMLDGRRGL